MPFMPSALARVLTEPQNPKPARHRLEPSQIALAPLLATQQRENLAGRNFERGADRGRCGRIPAAASLAGSSPTGNIEIQGPRCKPRRTPMSKPIKRIEIMSGRERRRQWREAKPGEVRIGVTCFHAIGWRPCSQVGSESPSR
jgi:hypothetical protein